MYEETPFISIQRCTYYTVRNVVRWDRYYLMCLRIASIGTYPFFAPSVPRYFDTSFTDFLVLSYDEASRDRGDKRVSSRWKCTLSSSWKESFCTMWPYSFPLSFLCILYSPDIFMCDDNLSRHVGVFSQFCLSTRCLTTEGPPSPSIIWTLKLLKRYYRVHHIGTRSRNPTDRHTDVPSKGHKRV